MENGDYSTVDFTSNDTFHGEWTSSEHITSTTDLRSDGVQHHKRPFEGNYYAYEPPAKRPAVPTIQLGAGFKWNLQALANAADAVQWGGKSPVSALNELGVRVMYTVVRQAGPAHCPSFNVSVTVADLSFEGRGHSKREARADAARACLAALLARAGRVLPPLTGQPAPASDFTADFSDKPASQIQRMDTNMLPPANVAEEIVSTVNSQAQAPAASPAPSLFGVAAPAATHKSPINLLYESYPGLVFHCTFGDGSALEANAAAPEQLSHSMRFKVVCQIKEQKYEGYGSSKKLAKLAAARSALAVLDEGRAEPGAPPATTTGFLPQTLADHVGKLVNEKFNELMKDDVVHSKRKVLAGIVVTINNRPEGAKVIAVTTGTKCVSGEHMSVRGMAVNDCHAEVAARRCLQRHLYAQLLQYANAKDPKQSIPESDIEPAPTGGYHMKPNRQVHLYVSTAPCGDGRIFSPHEDLEPDKHPNRLARGQLRTKIESGEGTIPVKKSSNVVQTWDGVLQGERLLTMSCSDKVARWCVVGLQGALLSRFISPVYLHSVVLGSLLHPHHMYRAICGRIEAYMSCLPPPFHLHRPMLARAASTEARTPNRAPSFSVCWCANTPLPEVINATTGKLESGQPSLLCKQSMFARWQYLMDKLPLLPQEVEPGAEKPEVPSNLSNLFYNEAKLLCPAYQAAKERLITAFEKAKLGRWIKKPIEQDQFYCEITNADPTVLFAWVGHNLCDNTVQANVMGIEFDVHHQGDDLDGKGGRRSNFWGEFGFNDGCDRNEEGRRRFVDEYSRVEALEGKYSQRSEVFSKFREVKDDYSREIEEFTGYNQHASNLQGFDDLVENKSRGVGNLRSFGIGGHQDCSGEMGKLQNYGFMNARNSKKVHHLNVEGAVLDDSRETVDDGNGLRQPKGIKIDETHNKFVYSDAKTIEAIFGDTGNAHKTTNLLLQKKLKLKSLERIAKISETHKVTRSESCSEVADGTFEWRLKKVVEATTRVESCEVIGYLDDASNNSFILDNDCKPENHNSNNVNERSIPQIYRDRQIDYKLKHFTEITRKQKELRQNVNGHFESKFANANSRILNDITNDFGNPAFRGNFSDSTQKNNNYNEAFSNINTQEAVNSLDALSKNFVKKCKIASGDFENIENVKYPRSYFLTEKLAIDSKLKH